MRTTCFGQLQKERAMFGSSKIRLSPRVIFYCPFQDVTSVLVTKCYMLLCPYVYGLQHIVT